jgi:hypothetical protein
VVRTDADQQVFFFGAILINPFPIFSSFNTIPGGKSEVAILRKGAVIFLENETTPGGNK